MNNNDFSNITFKLTELRTQLISLINNVELPIPIIEGVLDGILLDLKNQELVSLRNEIISQVQKEIKEDFISKQELERMKAEGLLIEPDNVQVEPYEDNGDTTENEGVTDGTKTKKTK